MKKTIGIDGMSCDHCVRRVRNALSEMKGVMSVNVDLGAKRAEIEGEALDDESIRSAVEEAGYAVRSIA
jgi:copper chaperone